MARTGGIRTCAASRLRTSGASEQLGGGAIVGDEIWNQQSGVRIKLGPLSMREYLDFLPSGTAHEPLKSLAKFIARGEIDFEVQLILKKDECRRASWDRTSRRAAAGMDFLGQDAGRCARMRVIQFFRFET